MHSQKQKTIFLVAIAVLVLSIVLSTWGIPKILNLQVKKNIQIEESSQTFGKFLKLPMPLVFKIYVFNVTNTDEVNAGGKPKLVEIGPYVYQQYRERTILGYGPNDTVKYNLKKSFYFDEKASAPLTQNDEVTVINFSYMAAILTIQGMMPDAVGIINPALEELFTNLTDPFLRVKAKDLFFDGIFLNCKGEHSALGLVCGQIKSDAPPTMRPAEDGSGFYFSMFSHLNRSETGPYEMVRGTKNVHDLGNIVSYRGKTAMNQWHDPYCGMINGSDSTIFAPINENNIPLKQYSFEPDICRSLYVSYVERATLFNMNVFYYEMDNQALAAKSANPNNKCFCKRNWSANHDGCLIMGILNLMPCQGAPAIASLPHFYLASEELLQYFESGVQPDQEKHKTYAYIEQVTGVPVKGAKRLQFNIELRQMKGVPQLENVKTGLFPMLWIEEGAEIPEEVQKELLQSYKLLSYVEIVRWAILAIAIIVAIVAGALLARSSRMPIWPRNQVTMVLNPTNGNK